MRGKRRGRHCCFDVTNNCLYDGIIQFIYFFIRVPVKRWHFPRAGSLLMFYVSLLSRICVLLRKKANFSQCSREGELALCLSRTQLLFCNQTSQRQNPALFCLKGNATHTHTCYQELMFFSLPTQGPGVGCPRCFNGPPCQAYELAALAVPIWGMKRLRCLKSKYPKTLSMIQDLSPSKSMPQATLLFLCLLSPC